MRIDFHPAALQELIDSARYYETRLPGLGTDFKSDVDRSLDRLNVNPDIGVVCRSAVSAFASRPVSVFCHLQNPRLDTVDSGGCPSTHKTGLLEGS